MIALLVASAHAGEVPYVVDAEVRYRCTDVAIGASLGTGDGLLHLDVSWDAMAPPAVAIPLGSAFRFGPTASPGAMAFEIEATTGPVAGTTFQAAGAYGADSFDTFPGLGDGVSFYSRAQLEPNATTAPYTFRLVLATGDDVYQTGGARMPDALPAALESQRGRSHGFWSDGVTRCSWTVPAGSVRIACAADADTDGICDHLEDEDGDGYGPATDCDESDPTVHWGATDDPDDGIDQNCDGGDMCWGDGDADGARVDWLIWSLDVDCDDVGEAHTAAPLDCDDEDFTRFPGAREGIGDGVDSDCDALETCYDDLDGDGARLDSLHTSASLTCDGRIDAVESDPLDCDDVDPASNPGGTEIPNDGIDQDCDGADLVASTFADVEDLFSTRCTPCHTGPTPLGSGGLVFQGPADLVNVSSGPATPPYVVPFDPEGSFVYRKVTNTQGVGNGAQMPFGGFLTADEILLIETWIADGALP